MELKKYLYANKYLNNVLLTLLRREREMLSDNIQEQQNIVNKISDDAPYQDIKQGETIKLDKLKEDYKHLCMQIDYCVNMLQVENEILENLKNKENANT